MLGYLILILLQIVAAWFGEPQISKLLPGNLGSMVNAFIEGAIFGLIVWVVGLVGSFVLKDVRTPTAPTLVSAVVGGLIGAAIVVFLPQLGVRLPSGVNPQFIPIAGAIIGYLLRR